MTSSLKLSLLAAAAAVSAVPAAAQRPQTAAAAQATCLPEHAAAGHCTPSSVPVQQSTPQPQPARPTQPAASAQTACSPEHAAAGHCTPAPAPAERPAPQRQPAPQLQPVTPAQTTCLPEHAAAGHCTPSPAQQLAPQPQPATPAQTTCLPEHAAAGHCTPAQGPAQQPQPAPPPQATCLPEHAAMGHCTPTQSPGGEAAGAPAEGTNLAAGNAPPPEVPVANAADAFYDPAAMHKARHHLGEFHGNKKFFQLFVNELEYHPRNGRDGLGWELDAWYGGDINRLWFRSKGEGEAGRQLEKLETQLLYSRAIDPYFNLQGGLRYDIRPNPQRVYATIGLEGLAPSFFELEAFAFLSNKGELTARVGGYYDQRITQRLILQPSAEFNFAAQNSPDIHVGAGLSDAEIALRLRYDIRRDFAPYIGVQYERAFGRTRRYLREEGERAGAWSMLTGIRFWF
jgi:copper resistance protein B